MREQATHVVAQPTGDIGDSVGHYLGELIQVPLLTPSEERYLAERIAQGFPATLEDPDIARRVAALLTGTAARSAGDAA